MKALQAIRGMNDILPEDIHYWQHVEATAASLMQAYGYVEIRPPIIEKTELFKRGIGEVTDIVEKEMYTFEDRNGDSLTLRPECTASVVRAGVEHGLLYNKTPRLWYMGPMFRHEKPQLGRYRQFYQFGAEAFGMANPQVDAELILLGSRLWRALGIGEVALELNSLGEPQARQRHRRELVDYFRRHEPELDEDSRRRLGSNPLRILDSKNPAMQGIIEDAPRLMDYLDAASLAHFETLTGILTDCGVAYSLNPRLVRGLDYYSRTVFEWTTTKLGAQGTICGGGRYDYLVDQVGGKATAGIGFSGGFERIIALLKQADNGLEADTVAVYVAAVGESAGRMAVPLAERLRDRLAGLKAIVDAGEGSFKAKLKRADRSQAKLALIIGDDEAAKGCVTVKYLRENSPQQIVVEADLAALLSRYLGQGSD